MYRDDPPNIVFISPPPLTVIGLKKRSTTCLFGDLVDVFLLPPKTTLFVALGLLVGMLRSEVDGSEFVPALHRLPVSDVSLGDILADLAAAFQLKQAIKRREILVELGFKVQSNDFQDGHAALRSCKEVLLKFVKERKVAHFYGVALQNLQPENDSLAKRAIDLQAPVEVILTPRLRNLSSLSWVHGDNKGMVFSITLT